MLVPTRTLLMSSSSSNPSSPTSPVLNTHFSCPYFHDCPLKAPLVPAVKCLSFCTSSTSCVYDTHKVLSLSEKLFSLSHVKMFSIGKPISSSGFKYNTIIETSNKALAYYMQNWKNIHRIHFQSGNSISSKVSQVLKDLPSPDTCSLVYICYNFAFSLKTQSGLTPSLRKLSTCVYPTRY